MRINPVLAAMALTLAGPALAAPPSPNQIPYKPLNPGDYLSFVRNWTPSDKPLCAVISTAAQWDALMQPAPIMGAKKPFAPPKKSWGSGSVLVVARVIPQGDTSKVFHVTSVTREHGHVRIDYEYAPTPPASSSMKWYMALGIFPQPAEVDFVENGRHICVLQSGAGQWVTPPIGAH